MAEVAHVLRQALRSETERALFITLSGKRLLRGLARLLHDDPLTLAFFDALTLHRVGGTPRTIKGPLYVAGTPLSKGEARLDDGSEQGDVLFMDGQVRDMNGKPITGAVVDVWHANTLGGYSFFDPSQSNITCAVGSKPMQNAANSVRFCPRATPAPGRQTQKLPTRIGRHGNRPAHIHCFVSAPGLSQADYADQHRRRRLPARRHRLHPRRPDPGGAAVNRSGGDPRPRPERAVRRDHVRLHPAFRKRVRVKTEVTRPHADAA
jgi:protocatechuate 3,4-dioxygenase beta subunit